MTQECTRCLLSEDVPGVRLNAQGLCNVCVDFDRDWGDWSTAKVGRRATLDAMLRVAKSQNCQYDALVPLSGGKDSSYALYLARKELNLRVLAVTYDNGFLTDHARENIRSAVDILGADHIYVRNSWPMMKQLYRTFFMKSGMFCAVCMRGINVAIDMAAATYGIPVVLAGTCKRTEEHVSKEFFIDGQAGFYTEVLRGDPLEQQSPLGYRGNLRRRLATNYLPGTVAERVAFGITINLPDFLDWDYDEIFKVITNELEWKAHKEEAEHTDCKVEELVNYIRWKKYPVLIPEMMRFSKLATAGLLTKEEARARIDTVVPLKEPEALAYFLEALDITREDFEAVIADKDRHFPYLEASKNTPRAKARNLVRKVLKNPFK